MTNREKILAEPCGCGASIGGGCLPKTLTGGFHASRLAAAGIPLREPLARKYPASGQRNDPRP